MRKVSLTCITIGAAWAALLCSCGLSGAPRREAESVAAAGRETVSGPADEQARNEETASALWVRMGELYGDNPPGVVGFSADSKRCPEFIGGAYINADGRLVIQIRGDSAAVRRRLEKELGSDDFVVEPNLRFTQQELLRINKELGKRWEELINDPVMRNVKSTGVTAHEIEISLIVNSPEKQLEFRRKVMDSPAFCFTGPACPVVNETTGVNDTLGVYLRPEYEVYSTQTKQVKFILYNRSAETVTFGAHYSVTYRDREGVWRELPVNDIAFDMEYGVEPGATWEFTAELYPDVHPNPAGNYRFFYRVKAGSAGPMLMMADFRLSDREDEWREAPRTAVPGGAKETRTENVKKRER